jgi:hypothetical protein
MDMLWIINEIIDGLDAPANVYAPTTVWDDMRRSFPTTAAARSLKYRGVDILPGQNFAVVNFARLV